MRLRCTNCAAEFEGEPDASCPKCLRRTTVFEAVDESAPREETAAASWPAGTACPLCMALPASEAIWHLKIAKDEEWTTVRCRCCDPCRERVVGASQLRWWALSLVAVGTLAWIFSLVSDLPLRVLAVSKREAILVSTLAWPVVVGVPLLLLDRVNHKLRRTLEVSWLLRSLQARLGHPEGKLPTEQWKVTADAPGGQKVIDATELLRS